MRVHDMIVDERRQLADRLGALSPAELRAPSLCDGWTVHDVAAHLVSYLRYGRLKLYAGIAATGGDFDEINRRLTRQLAARPSLVLIDQLRRWSHSRISIPRTGYDPVLADIVLHDLDIRRPLGLDRDIPTDRLRLTFHHLATRPSPGFALGGRLRGLRLVATDTGWTHGDGPTVRGRAEDLVLAMGGRAVGLSTLEGDGLARLRDRLHHPVRPGLGRRLVTVVRVLLDPPPPGRRSRAAVGLD